MGTSDFPVQKLFLLTQNSLCLLSGHTFTTFTFPSGAPSPRCLMGDGKADLASLQAAGMNINNVHKTNLPP